MPFEGCQLNCLTTIRPLPRQQSQHQNGTAEGLPDGNATSRHRLKASRPAAEFRQLDRCINARLLPCLWRALSVARAVCGARCLWRALSVARAVCGARCLWRALSVYIITYSAMPVYCRNRPLPPNFRGVWNGRAQWGLDGRLGSEAITERNGLFRRGPSSWLRRLQNDWESSGKVGQADGCYTSEHRASYAIEAKGSVLQGSRMGGVIVPVL